MVFSALVFQIYLPNGRSFTYELNSWQLFSVSQMSGDSFFLPSSKWKSKRGLHLSLLELVAHSAAGIGAGPLQIMRSELKRAPLGKVINVWRWPQGWISAPFWLTQASFSTA